MQKEHKKSGSTAAAAAAAVAVYEGRTGQTINHWTARRFLEQGERPRGGGSGGGCADYASAVVFLFLGLVGGRGAGDKKLDA